MQQPAPDLNAHTANLTRVTSWPALREWRRRIHPSKMKPRTILLCLAVADFVNDRHDWQAWPSQSTLASLNRDTARGTRERIREAVAAGWLLVMSPGRPGRSARYGLTMPPYDDSIRHESGPTERPRSGRTMGPGSGPTSGPNRASDVPKEVRGRQSEGLSEGTIDDSFEAHPAPPDGGPVTPPELKLAPGSTADRYLKRWAANT